MTEKKKTESDSPRSERKIVLRNMQSSEYARKKYIIKKTTRNIPTTGSYGSIGGGMTAEEAGGSNKDRQQRIQRANAFSSSQRDRRREKQAEYIKENAQNDRSESYYEQPYESDYEDTHSFNEDEQDLSSEKSEEKFVRKERAVSSASVEKDAASEKAERMKKASYIKEKLQKEIAAGKAAVYSEDNNPFNTQFSDTSETKGTVQLKKSEETEGSSYLGSSDHFSESKHKNSLENAEVKKAYKTKILGEKLNKRRMAAADMRSQAQTNAALIDAEKAKNAAIKNAEAEEFARDNIVPGIEMAAGYISAVKSGDAVGMITQPAVSLIKKNMGSLGKIYDNVSTISDAVQSSDSVGGAAVNAATSLAAGKVKSAVSNTLFKPSDERIEERLERKFRYIDRKTDKQMSRIQSEKRKALNGNISNRLEKELDRIERNQDKYKEKLAKQQKELQRQQQKNIYIKHNNILLSYLASRAAEMLCGENKANIAEMKSQIEEMLIKDNDYETVIEALQAHAEEHPELLEESEKIITRLGDFFQGDIPETEKIEEIETEENTMSNYGSKAPKFYNKEAFKDIQNKEYIRTDAATAFNIAQRAMEENVEFSAKYDGERSAVTVDGVRDRAFVEAMREEFNIPESSRSERQCNKPAQNYRREAASQEHQPAYFGHGERRQTQENTPKYYNREGFKDIQNKEYVRTDSKTAYAISQEAQKFGIDHSVKYDGEKSTVTLDGVKDKAFVDAVRQEFNIPENSRPKRQAEKPSYFGHNTAVQENRNSYPSRNNNPQSKEASYFNREGFKDIRNKTYIRTDSKTAYAISKAATKRGVEHSAKYDGVNSAVTVDGVRNRDFVDAVKKMAAWAEKVQIKEAQNQNRAKSGGAR